MRRLGMLVTLAVLGCTPSTSARPRAPEHLSTAELCERHVERSACMTQVEDARARLPARAFEQLEWCARHAQASASVQACFDASWGDAALVTARVSPPPPPSPPPSAFNDIAPVETPSEAEGMSEEQRLDRAKQLYMEADGLENEGYWTEATTMYIRAFEVAPDVRRLRPGLARRAGSCAWQAGDCETAKTYLEYFLVHDDGTDAEQTAWVRQILAEIEISGCTRDAQAHPAHYWN